MGWVCQQNEEGAASESRAARVRRRRQRRRRDLARARGPRLVIATRHRSSLYQLTIGWLFSLANGTLGLRSHHCTYARCFSSMAW